MDRVKPPPPRSEQTSSSGIRVEPLNDELLEPVIKLLRTLDNPVERAVLEESILDEIYFRLICNDRSGSLRHLLQHRGKAQQISFERGKMSAKQDIWSATTARPSSAGSTSGILVLPLQRRSEERRFLDSAPFAALRGLRSE
jgi:hypothetical protein